MLVLVVEDDGLLSMNIEAALTEAGHRTLGPIAWATEAIALAEKAKPDIALVDLSLRDGQVGGALARYLLRRWGVHSIFITGNTPDALCHQDVALGLLRKPFSRAELLKSLAVAKAMVDGTIPTLNVPTGFQPFPCVDPNQRPS